MVQVIGEKLSTGYFNHTDSFVVIFVFLCVSIYIRFHGLDYVSYIYTRIKEIYSAIFTSMLNFTDYISKYFC